MINCTIVDDDYTSLVLLQEYIKTCGLFHVQHVFTNPVEAIEHLNFTNTIGSRDVLFLDIEMPQVNGIDLINSLHIKPYIILTSTTDSYASAAFNSDVYDYIKKPISYDLFLKSAKKVHSAINNEANQSDYFFVKVNYQMQKIKKKDIQFIEANGDYVKVVTTDSKLLLTMTMKEMEDRLPAKEFVRVHRSYIVAVDKIDKIYGSEIMMGNHKIPIGNSFKELFINSLNIL